MWPVLCGFFAFLLLIVAPPPPPLKLLPVPISPSSPPTTLNVTAINGRNGKTIFQCWQLTSPIFAAFEQEDDRQPLYYGINPGAVGGQITFASVKPRTKSRAHPSPNKQFVYLASGTCKFSSPSGGGSVTIKGGRRGFIISANTADVSEEGHISEFEGGEQGSLVMIPFANGVEPQHKVLYDRPCEPKDQRDW